MAEVFVRERARRAQGTEHCMDIHGRVQMAMLLRRYIT
jgi:hypothetical protein